MKSLAPALAVTLLALALSGPALAQDDGGGDGLSLMQEGAELLLRGLMQEMEPALEDLQGFAEQVAPMVDGMTAEMAAAFAALIAKLDSLSHYDMPEILPNGDILIRRRPDAPVYVPPDGAEIDL